MTAADRADLTELIVAEGHRDNFEITLRADRGEPHPLRDSMLERVRASGTNLTIIAVGGDGRHHRAGSDRPLEGSLQVLDLFLTECEDSPKFRIVRTPADLPIRGDDGVLRLVLEIEGGRPFQQDYSSGLNPDQKLCLLRTFFKLGIRSIHLTHQGRNELGGRSERARIGWQALQVRGSCGQGDRQARHAGELVAPDARVLLPRAASGRGANAPPHTRTSRRSLLILATLRTNK